jgi:hypothetical protein
MFTMGLDIGSHSTKCVILDDGQLLTYRSIETGSDSVKTAHAAVDAAVHRRIEFWGEFRIELPDVKTDHLKIEDSGRRPVEHPQQDRSASERLRLPSPTSPAR